MSQRACSIAFAAFTLLISAAPLTAAAAGSVDLASIDPCSLITSAELSSAVGVPMGSGEHPMMRKAQFMSGTVPGATQCEWKRPAQREVSLALEEVDLYVMPFSETIFLAKNDRVGRASITSISGLGDDAYFVNTWGTMVLDVKRGPIMVRVAWLPGADPQTVIDAERTIAARVLSEL
jgi:hypothetical protein